MKRVKSTGKQHFFHVQLTSPAPSACGQKAATAALKSWCSSWDKSGSSSSSFVASSRVCLINTVSGQARHFQIHGTCCLVPEVTGPRLQVILSANLKPSLVSVITCNLRFSKALSYQNQKTNRLCFTSAHPSPELVQLRETKMVRSFDYHDGTVKYSHPLPPLMWIPNVILPGSEGKHDGIFLGWLQTTVNQPNLEIRKNFFLQSDPFVNRRFGFFFSPLHQSDK